MIRAVSDAPNAPKAIGPYSQAVISGNFAFLAGQVPINPDTGKLVDDSIEAQVTQVMKNIGSVLSHLKLDFSHVVKTTIFLSDFSYFQAVNTVYAEYMGETRPARSTVAVAGLPLGAKVEIEVVAVVEK